MHCAITPSPGHLLLAALLNVSEFCPVQQMDGRVLVSAQ